MASQSGGATQKKTRMKLIKFDTTNCISPRKGTSTVSFSKNGVIALNKQFSVQCGFTAGDKIAIFQDEENPYDWYIAKDDDGFELRWGNAAVMDNLKANNACLCKQFKEALNFPNDVAVSCLMAGEATKVGKIVYWGILTNSANWKGKV